MPLIQNGAKWNAASAFHLVLCANTFPSPMGDIEYDEPPTYHIFAGPES